MPVDILTISYIVHEIAVKIEKTTKKGINLRTSKSSTKM